MTEKAVTSEAEYEALKSAYRELADDFVAVQTYLALAIKLNGPVVASKEFLEDMHLNDDITFITKKNDQGGYTISVRG